MLTFAPANIAPRWGAGANNVHLYKYATPLGWKNEFFNTF